MKNTESISVDVLRDYHLDHACPLILPARSRLNNFIIQMGSNQQFSWPNNLGFDSAAMLHYCVSHDTTATTNILVWDLWYYLQSRLRELNRVRAEIRTLISIRGANRVDLIGWT